MHSKMARKMALGIFTITEEKKKRHVIIRKANWMVSTLTTTTLAKLKSKVDIKTV